MWIVSRRHWVPILVLALLAFPAFAQVSGRITGSVVDPSGNIVVGADITVTNIETGEAITARSNETGAFVFPNVPRGDYTVMVKNQGFSTLERKGVVVNANQSVALGNLQLAIGQVTETISVTAEGAQVQTDTSNQTALLTDNQLSGLMSRGRDIVSLMTVLPGVSQNPDGGDSLGGNWGTGTPNMQGLRSHWNSFLLDGQPGSDIDVLNFFTISVSMDAIEEVSVKSNSFQAEDGRLPGVQVNIVSKSGGTEFHGSGYYYRRHEMFNANNFFNNRLGIDKPLTRYHAFGATLGGPVYIPGKWNTNKDKLFFFLSREDWRIKLPGPILNTTLPTDLERRGDFSQSFDQNGALIVVKDPNTGLPFAGNVIPSGRINTLGQKLLGWHPAPNIFDRNITRGAYNYRFQERREQPKAQTQIKMDWLPTAADRISFRPRWWSSDLQGQNQSTAFGGNFYAQKHHYEYPFIAYQGSYTRTFTPSVVNEFNLGWSKAQELGDLKEGFELENVRRSKYGLENLKQLYPAANPLGLVPRMFFGGLPNSPSTDFDPRTPIAAKDTRTWMTNNVSWVKGNHNFKFGVFYELNRASEGPRSTDNGRHMGTFDFSRDANNPLDSNHPFANAILGNFRSYAESSGLSAGRGHIYTFEWFAQDSYKVTQRLNVDYGVRFYSFVPWQLTKDEGAAFALERYDRSKAPLLYVPAIDPATGRRVARNPVTGQLVPSPLIGAFVPNTGDRLNGTVVASDDSYPSGFRKRPPVQVAPRVGFAYDVFGNGRTAVRGGFSSTKQTIYSSQSSLWTTTTAPPILESPTIYYGNIDSYLNAGQVFFPASAQSFDKEFDKVATVYRWTFGVQQNLGFGTVLDATYVGSTGRHLRQSHSINPLYPGARFQPSANDPTTGRPLPDVFLRPIFGYQGIGYLEDSGWSNYNGLQVAVNRRYASGLQYGVAYTWSKAMGISDQDGGGLPSFLDYRSYLYGKLGYDQTHVLVLNYLWSVPNVSAVANSRIGKAALHNWEVAGITSFASGTPRSLSFSYTDGVDRWGGGDSPRLIMVDNPLLGRGERSFARWFNTNSVRAPGMMDWGNAPRDVFRGPGINNWDFTIYKNFPVKERARFVFRWEFYNLFNHTQWSGVDTGARFDAQGNQVNGQFGQITSARQERQMQGSLRFEF